MCLHVYIVCNSLEPHDEGQSALAVVTKGSSFSFLD